MKNYIKDEIQALDLNLKLAKKHEKKSAKIKKIKNIMLEIREVFRTDADTDCINNFYEQIPLINVSLADEIRRYKN